MVSSIRLFYTDIPISSENILAKLSRILMADGQVTLFLSAGCKNNYYLAPHFIDDMHIISLHIKERLHKASPLLAITCGLNTNCISVSLKET